MTDALRADRSSSPREAPDRERDARVEELLLSGLDHYFAGQYELAINVWTRVLFLDRGHARARAYLERARSAVAEQQREADELFHAGAAALRQGDRAVARQLLMAAVERGSGGEEALALLQHLDRIDAAAGATPGRPVRAQVAPPETDSAATRRTVSRDPRILWLAGGVVAGVLLAVVVSGYLWIMAEPLELGTAATPVPLAVADSITVPSPGEIRILRARDLAAKGRLREALRVLEAGERDERHRHAVDELRASIQRRLIEGVAVPPLAAVPQRSTGSGAPPASGTAGRQ